MAAENADAKVHQVGVDANSVRGLRRLGLNGGQWTASGEQKKTGQQNTASQGRPTTKPDRNELLFFHDKVRSRIFFNAGPIGKSLLTPHRSLRKVSAFAARDGVRLIDVDADRTPRTIANLV